MPQEIVYAIHNFVAENEDEIDFSVGEPIIVLEKDEKYMDGWWQGRNTKGDVGLFPMNYTTPVQPTQTPPMLTPSYSSPVSSATSSSQSSKSLSQRPASDTPEYPNAVPEVPTERKTDLALHLNISTSTSVPNAPDPSPQQPQSNPPQSPSAAQATIPAKTIITHAVPALSDVAPPPPSTAAPEEWTIDEVANWLRSVGLENVIDTFIEQEITGDVLMALTSEALKELGIAAFGRRYKVMHAIEKLKANVTQQRAIQNKSDTTNASSDPPTSAPLFQTQKSVQSPKIAQLPSADANGLYQSPRKAPQPPPGGFFESGDSLHRKHMAPSTTDTTVTLSSRRPPSSNLSRSNTFHSVSSKMSSSSSSNGTSKSREKSPISLPRFPIQKSLHKSIETEGADVHPPSQNGQSQPSLSRPSQDSSAHPPESTISPPPSEHEMSPMVTDQEAVLPFSDTAPDFEGWLYKQSDKYKTWNKRWFVLKGPNLFYFKSPKDIRMKGIIHLRGYRILVDDTAHASKYSFRAQHEHERTFFFHTDTMEAMRSWIKMLMKATITRDYGSPVMSSSHMSTVSLDAARLMRPRPPSIIMYKPLTRHGSQPGKQVSKMRELPENEERGINQSERRIASNEDKQTRESGIVVHPHTEPFGKHASDAKHDDVVSPPPVPSTTDGVTPVTATINMEEDEDLIDPHRVPPKSPIQSPIISPSNTISTTSQTTEEPEPKTPREWNRGQYIEWINRHLPPGKRVIDLSSAFRNGEKLILLLESLSGKTVRRAPVQKGGSVSMMMLDNIVAAFKFMGREGVVVDGRYTIKDVFSGNESKIMDMLDSIRAWSEKTPDTQPSPNSPR